MRSRDDDLNPWVWGALPVAAALGYVIVLLYDVELRIWSGADFTMRGVDLLWLGGWLAAKGELGILENVQVALLAAVAGMAVWILRRPGPMPVRWLKRWVGVLLVGCLYVLGEEISWGQHYLGWTTPEWYERWNYQGETNLHNLHSGWMVFKPKGALEYAIIFAALLRPAWRSMRRTAGLGATGAREWIWPTHAGSVAALMLLVTALVKRVDKGLNLELVRASGLDYGELREFLIYGFVAIYLWSLARRLVRWQAADRGTPGAKPGSGREAGELSVPAAAG
ncbi:MAG TPA: hypothetical protein VGB20_07780 [bacterium]